MISGSIDQMLFLFPGIQKRRHLWGGGAVVEAAHLDDAVIFHFDRVKRLLLPLLPAYKEDGALFVCHTGRIAADTMVQLLALNHDLPRGRWRQDDQSAGFELLPPL